MSYDLDVHTFKSLIRLEQRSQQEDLKLIESLGVDYTTISYEDFVSHPDQLFSEIFSFLNLPSERATKSSFDIMIKDLREVVENYEQIDECTRELGMSLN